MTYQITNKDGYWKFKSKRYTVSATRSKGHIWICVSGPGSTRWTRKGLTAITDKVTDFEMKVILIHFARQARRYGKGMPTLKYVNYADIFGSCFE